MSAPHLAGRLAAEAVGALEAQRVITSIAAGHAEPSVAWLKFIEIAAEAGWRTPACRAFLHELAKRAATAASVQ